MSGRRSRGHQSKGNRPHLNGARQDTVGGRCPRARPPPPRGPLLLGGGRRGCGGPARIGQGAPEGIVNPSGPLGDPVLEGNAILCIVVHVLGADLDLDGAREELAPAAALVAVAAPAVAAPGLVLRLQHIERLDSGMQRLVPVGLGGCDVVLQRHQGLSRPSTTAEPPPSSLAFIFPGIGAQVRCTMPRTW